MDVALVVVLSTIVAPIGLILAGLVMGHKWADEVWGSLCITWTNTMAILSPPVPPEPPLPEIDILEQKVNAILATRPKNPRLVKDSLARRQWKRDFNNLLPPVVHKVEDEDDIETIRDWQGRGIRIEHKSGVTHRANETCYICERKRQ